MDRSDSGDTELGAFSADGPWVVDIDDLAWLVGTRELRERIRAQVPDLIRPRRLPPGRRVAKIFGRFGRGIGRWRFAKRFRGIEGSESRAMLSRELRQASEELGVTFIKLGQILASGDGVFPDELVAEFKRCRDQVPAEPFDVVRATVEADLGQPLEAVFAEFDPEPLAAASIAQVHRARLHPPKFVDHGPQSGHKSTNIAGGGAEVVVKVQRPGVSERVHADIAASAWLAPHLVGRIPVAALANPPALVEVFAQSIIEELDFRLEAENMIDVARSLRALDQTGYVVPRPHPRLVTRRVLVMERLSGFGFDDIDEFTTHGVDPHEIIRTGMVAFLEGAMLNGIFHGDLHGGNLFVQPDGRTALLDYGIVGRLTEPKRVAMLKVLMSSISNNIVGQVEAIRDLGALPEDVDIDQVIADLGLDQTAVDPTTMTQQELVDEVNRLLKAMLGYGARMPRELLLFAKNLVFLDGAIATLTPDIDLLAEITHIAMWFMRRHGNQIAADMGVKTDDFGIDLSIIKGQFGIDPATDEFTFRDLRERRELITRRMAGHE